MNLVKAFKGFLVPHIGVIIIYLLNISLIKLMLFVTTSPRGTKVIVKLNNYTCLTILLDSLSKLNIVYLIQ